MDRTLVFDTETTDLIPNSVTDERHQPHIIEFYGHVVNGEGESLEELEFLAHPGMKLSPTTTRITGLTDSDLKNSAGRHAHAILGAVFLKQFVDRRIPWAHLDIAGVGDVDKDQPYCPKGATGFGVRLLADYLQRLR